MRSASEMPRGGVRFLLFDVVAVAGVLEVTDECIELHTIHTLTRVVVVVVVLKDDIQDEPLMLR
jgi:hypothetical protein